MEAKTNNERRRRVLIVDITSTGHHPSYIRWILDSGIASTAEVIIAARVELLAHPELLASRSAYTGFPIEVPPKLDALLANWSTIGLMRVSWMVGRLYRKACREVARSGPVDFVIVPFIDDCIIGLSLPRAAFGGVPWIAITMRTMFHYSEMGVVAPRQRFVRFRRWLLYRALRQDGLRCLLTIDPTLAAYAQKRHDNFMRKIDYLPDPSDLHAELPSKAVARSQLGVPPGASLVVLFGEISARKGVNFLLEAAADPQCRDQIHVLLAGRCRDRAALVTSGPFQRLAAAGRIHLVEGYVRGAEERQVIAAADCMWVGHTDFYGTSGVMVLAARHALPVLATEEGLIGYLARQHRIGVIIQPKNRASVVAALNRLVEQPEWFGRAGIDAAAAFRRHDSTEFQRLVAEKVAFQRS
jgi:glycosyltransferase involved in cell wall biosynthesis